MSVTMCLLKISLMSLRPSRLKMPREVSFFAILLASFARVLVRPMPMETGIPTWAEILSFIRAANISGSFAPAGGFHRGGKAAQRVHHAPGDIAVKLVVRGKDGYLMRLDYVRDLEKR